MTCMFKVIYFKKRNFRNKCIEIYEFDPALFLSAWQACLKKTGIKL